MTGRIRDVVVVGGGTAGWLAACHLARKHRGHLRVTLVESPQIATIGVGEGTVPTLRRTLDYLGISETELLRECDATFKQGIRFQQWRQPRDGQPHHYYHPFDYPRLDHDATARWLAEGQSVPFADWVGIQAALCEQGLGPKTMVHPEFEGVAHYAYHLDAAKFSALLTRHGTQRLGVVHRKTEVTEVITDGDRILSLVTGEGPIQGDLYIDCSGFSARLIGQALGVPWCDRGDTLLVDRALAIQVPYEDPEAPIPCHTLSTAMEAGWIWDIGLTGRRGVGHVYASRYLSDEQAEAQLRAYLGPVAEGIPCRTIEMKVGYRAQAWRGNCVAIGLSGGFVEPLEATGLLLFDLLSRMLAEQLPLDGAGMATAAPRFNARVTHAWERVIDFIKLHYALSDRDDSEFWRANRDPASWSPRLREDLAHWRHAPPAAYDFASTLEVFNLENYLYVLYGMAFDTRVDPERLPEDTAATRAQQRLQDLRAQAGERLLPHRALLAKIRRHGLQRV